jgi:hypothetical protein
MHPPQTDGPRLSDLSPEQLEVINRWRAGPDHPSRAEAVRRLIERRLTGEPRTATVSDLADEGLRG